MNEEDAQRWIAGRFGVEALERLRRFEALLVQENLRQNLVSRPSLASLWMRHIVDSAQLIDLAPKNGLWIDIGTGGGFPGMVVAILRQAPIMFVEPRRQRAAFLQAAAGTLALRNVDVRHTKIAGITNAPAAVISARAVASLEMLLRDTKGVANRDTIYVFPRGRSASDEVSQLSDRWRGVFHVEQSITDAEAGIVVASAVRPA